MKFNINNHVRVKLTDHGRATLRAHWEDLASTFPKVKARGYTPPNEDADGWSRWQLWVLMETFGPIMGITMTNAFETEIEIEVRE